MSKRSVFSLCLIFAGAAVLNFIGYLFYLGLFSPVDVQAKTVGPYFLVYKSEKGDYRHTGKTVGELVRELQSIGAGEVKGFAIYYDDPKKVKAEDLRSDVGVVLQDKDRRRAAGILQKYQTREFPALEGAVSSFPLKNTFSVFLGSYKVHPKLVKFVEARGMVPQYTLEIYDFGRTTTYFMPFSEQKL
jgi:hypothetical protein